jgi:NADH dehydrogenase FAD-containing subunit
MSKTVVILGAGLTGLPLAHYILKHYADKFDLRLVLVSRSDELYWNIAAPRAAIPGQFNDEQVFYAIPPAFAKYPAHRFEFVHGNVVAWRPDNSTVDVVLHQGLEREIVYHTLVVATGSDYSAGMPWKLIGTTQETKTALDKLRSDVKKADSIVVGGGGPTGVEFAGELGYEYAKARNKKVTLIMSDPLPLDSRVRDATRIAAKKELEKLNVIIIADARVTKVRDNNVGGKIIELTKSDGTQETLETDLFTPTWGVKFNTSFAPPSLQESNGRLKVTKTLRSPGYNNVFLVGDCANMDSYAAMVREKQVRYLASALGQYFKGANLDEFIPQEKIGMTVAIGRSRGVGDVLGLNMWSFFVWYFKGRHMCTNISAEYVAGDKLILGAF